MRGLVERGTYPSVSSAYEAASEALFGLEAAREQWWRETIRRCEEAEKHPERLLDADTFFRKVRQEIEQIKASTPRS